MTRKQQELLDQLIAVAGSPDIVREALRTLNADTKASPDMREVIRQILVIRLQRDELASSVPT